MKDSRELNSKKEPNKEQEKEIKRIKEFIQNTFKTPDGLKTLVWLAKKAAYDELSVGQTNEMTYLNEGKKFIFLNILAGLDNETKMKFYKELLTNNE